MGRFHAGAPLTIRNSPFNSILRNMASSNPEPKKEPKPEKKWVAKLTKEQILDLRAKHEFEGWTPQQLMAHFDISYSLCKNYIEYYTQRDLIPKKPKQ